LIEEELKMAPFNLSLFVLGCGAGLLPDALRIIKNRHEPQLPAYLRAANFWLGVVLLAALGGIVTWALGAQSVKEALAYGFAAPEIISRLAAKYVAEVDRGEAAFDLRQWWAG
jgi:hypothetical protein